MRKMTKRLLWGLLASLCLLSGCTEQTPEEKPPTSLAESESGVSVAEDSSVPVPAPSSKTNLLAVGDWGSCAKYVPSQRRYATLPVRVTGYVRGESAAKMVQQQFPEAYEEPEEGSQWVAAEYEVYISGFPMDKMGADSVISAHLEDVEDLWPQCSGRHFSGRVLTLSDEKTAFEGTLSGKLAYILPEKAADVCLVLGEIGEEQAVVSGVPLNG